MIKAAVLGSPISHSLSPLLHTVAYQELGLESEYTAIEISSGTLESFLATCDENWTGFSLTMPLKEEVLGCVTRVSPLSARIRSANTLVQIQGQWSATSTDVSGFTHALAAHGRDASGEVLIIGAGATARAAAAACDGVADRITVMNRSISRVEAISNCVEISDLEFVNWQDFGALEYADLIISTTPEGVTDSLVQSFPTDSSAVFFDVLYKPWPTLALRQWSASGAAVIDGLDLLIHQAIDQVSIFSGEKFDRPAMAELMRTHGVRALALST